MKHSWIVLNRDLGVSLHAYMDHVISPIQKAFQNHDYNGLIQDCKRSVNQ